MPSKISEKCCKCTRHALRLHGEATNDVPEPWLNLAHVYYDQCFYVNAIKLYENCLLRFYG